MKVVVLIPWRPGSGIRERNFHIARPYLEKFGWPLFRGDKDGPWKRAAAINDAADQAGDWDIALIADADTIPDHRATLHAVDLVQETKGAIRPHDKLWRLTPRGTRMVASRGRTSFHHRTMASGLFRGGGLLVVHRVGWDTVGGFSERYTGWGYEDSDFNVSMLIQVEWDRIPGTALHLYHPPAPQNTPECRANRRRYERLYRMHGKAIAKAHEDKGWGKEKIL